MSLLFSVSIESVASAASDVGEDEVEKKDSISSETILATKLEKLKNCLPRAKPPSRKLGKLLNSKHSPSGKSSMSGASESKQRPAEKDTSYEPPHDWALFSAQLMNKAWREDRRVRELKQSLKEKKSIWEKLNEKQLENLYVEAPPEDIRLFVQDIDPEFITAVAGRPIGHDNDGIRTYIKNVQDILRIRLTLGYRDDAILLLDANIRTEQKMIEIIQNNYQKYVILFEEFLAQDHSSAVQLLKQSNKIATELYDLHQEYKKINKMLKGITISLYKSEALWKTCKLNKIFLFMVSPLAWRRTYEPESENTEMQEPEKIIADLLNSGNENESVELTVEEILELAEKECSVHDKPVIYFTDPNQLLDILEYMETQNVNNLVHKEGLEQPLAQIKETMENVSIKFDNMINRLQLTVEKLETEIEWEVSRAQQLENKADQLIFVEFREIVSSTEILNLFCYVEDMYESVIGPNDANYGAKKMINVVEEYYRDELFYLDKIPAEIVAYLEDTAIKEHQRMIKFAAKASKQLAELENLSKTLKNTFKPPYKKPHSKPVMFRSRPLREYKPPPPPPPVLSQFELDFLEHFTEFCIYTDKAEDFQIDRSQIRKGYERKSPTQAHTTLAISTVHSGHSGHKT